MRHRGNYDKRVTKFLNRGHRPNLIMGLENDDVIKSMHRITVAS